MILSLHRACNGDWASLTQKTGVSDEHVRYFLEYAVQFLGNSGNYKGFGDAKFIPRLPATSLEALASVSPEATAAYKKASQVGGGIYETGEQSTMLLGYPNPEDGNHMTTYYEYPSSSIITKAEIDAVGDFLEQKRLPLENTRLRKTETGDFELLIASGISSPLARDRDLGDEESWVLPAGSLLHGKKLRLVYGDYLNEMAKISHEVKLAELNAANDTQKSMLDAYARSFSTGSIESFKDAQRFWVKDQGPVIETNLGFVETYRDPHGVRGEWEGFVALVCIISREYLFWMFIL